MNDSDNGAIPQQRLPETISGVISMVAGHEQRLTNLDRAVINVLGRSEQQTNLLLEIKASVVATQVKVDSLVSRFDGHVEYSENRGMKHSTRLETLERTAHEEVGAAKARGKLVSSVPVIVAIVSALAAAGSWVYHLAKGSN